MSKEKGKKRISVMLMFALRVHINNLFIVRKKINTHLIGYKFSHRILFLLFIMLNM